MIECEMCAGSKWKSACPECNGTGKIDADGQAPSNDSPRAPTYVRQLVDDPNSASGKSLRDVEVSAYGEYTPITVRASTAPAAAPTLGISEEERHAIGHARHMVKCSSDEEPECCFDYQLVQDLLNVIDRAALTAPDQRGADEKRPAYCASADSVCHYPACTCVGNEIDPTNGTYEPATSPAEPEREALKAWFNNLPCEGLGKTHWDQLEAILACSVAESEKPLTGRPGYGPAMPICDNCGCRPCMCHTLPAPPATPKDTVAVTEEPLIERAAIQLWNRFANPNTALWEDETHKAEYRDAARQLAEIYAAAPPATPKDAGR